MWPIKIRMTSLSLHLLLFLCAGSVFAQSSIESTKRFDKEGLRFEYASNWQVRDQRSGDVQQAVLTEKDLDAQIMITVLQSPVNSTKEEEAARHAVVEPAIAMLLKQYSDAGIQIERAPLSGEVARQRAEGLELRFAVDGFPGTTQIYWLVLDKRMVNLIFIRPEKTAPLATVCWDLIRHTIGVNKVDTKGSTKQ